MVKWADMATERTSTSPDENQISYIPPRLTNHSSFKELLKSKLEYGDYDYLSDDKFTLTNLSTIKRAFVISDPGYGKTRLLKEIVLCSQGQNKQGIFIDLKKVDGDIESYITQKTAGADEINDDFTSTKLKNTSLLKSKGFALRNTEATIVCLDALDEIKFDEFSKFIERIKDFSGKYKRIHLYISCRFQHFKKEQEAFTDSTFSFVEIKQLTNDQIHEYLQQSGLTGDDIKRIMFFFNHKTASLIQVPRYLEMVLDTIQKNSIEYTSKLTKTDIFEIFIYKKLEIEEKRCNAQKKEIIKRVLEKLALTMEIYQSNLITKEELITFFDDVKSNLSISFLQQVPVEIFYSRSLLKDNIDTIEFENTEFQEYLAAKELLRLGRTEQVMFDIAVDHELKEIFPSWFNTLGFVIDLDISLLKPILHFGTSGNSTVQDEAYHRLLTSVDTNRLPVEDRKAIFKNIFDYYNDVQHWIRLDIAGNLAHYFHPSQQSLLRKCLELKGSTYITKTNVATLLKELIELDVFNKSEKAYWKNQLIKFIEEKNSILQRAAISALSKYKDIVLIKRVTGNLDLNDNAVIQALIYACLNAQPNDKFSIDCFVKWTKHDREYIQARYGLWEVKEKKAVKYLLKCFVDEPDFLEQFMHHETIFSHREDDQIIQNIRNVWDEEIEVKLRLIVLSAFSSDLWYETERALFIKNIVSLLKEKDDGYLFNLIAEVKKSEQLRGNLFSMHSILALLLKKKDVAKFVDELRKIGEESSALMTLLSMSHYKKDVYEEGRNYFDKEYSETEKRWDSETKKARKESNLYRDFLFKLEPEKGNFYPDVFHFYIDNHEKLQSLITVKDKTRLKRLIINSVLEKFDPGKQELKITASEGGRTSYTTHSFIHIFGDCLRVAELLKINISKYRQRIINYIPFAYHDHRQAIFSLVPNLTDGEVKNFLKLYTQKRTDDLQRFMPDSFISASKKYGITGAIPILKKFVDDSKLLLQYRTSALEAIAIIQPDEKYLKYIFGKSKNKKDDGFRIAEDANKYLIEKFQNDDAIEWRFGQIQKRAFSFIEAEGVHNVSPQEGELHSRSFASPISELKHPKYTARFLSLLQESFKIFQRGKDYQSYAQYIWEIVAAYFHNLRETKSYAHLKKLESYIEKNSSEEGMNWFKYKLHNLRQEYLRYVGKPQNIAACIRTYNKLKETQYLNIATSKDLQEIVKRVIDEDLRKWVESEGAYKFIQEASRKQEDLIQKTIKTQFENCLIKRGLRANEVSIKREEQLLDDKRSDFLISYGFIGPILIETKRVDREEIFQERGRRAYKSKLLQYLDGTKSDWGIFLIFQINAKRSLKEYLPKIKEVYKDCNNIEIIGLNCIEPAKYLP